MSIKQSSKRLISIKGLLATVLLFVLSAPILAANYPLEIIQPKAGLDTKNRFYKAYPGLEYNVRLAVIGGVFPYRFKLDAGPSDMSIDTRGEITWANPIASGTPYNVAVSVTDAQSNTTNVSWAITVTTNGFRFIDAVNGTSATSGGTGSFTNPWKSIKDMYEGDVYESKTANSYAGEFVYWRAGGYVVEGYKEDSGRRVPFVGNRKPQVWLAYPGETPIMDMAAAHVIFYGGTDNIYIDGFEFNINSNVKGQGIQIDSSANNVTIRNNKFYGITNGFIGGNNSFIFISRHTVGSNYAIQDNEMFNNNNGYGLLGYNARNLLVEDNLMYNINGHAIGPKEGTQKWFIRANRMYSNGVDSIGLQYSNTSGIKSGDIEISYNIVESGGGKVRINSNQTATGLPVYIFRNTFMDEAEQNLTTTSNGLFHWSNNVIVNETSHPDKIERYRIDAPSRLVVANNLVGKGADNIVDSQGYLTSGYNSYVGTHGHQIKPRISPPGLTVR